MTPPTLRLLGYLGLEPEPPSRDYLDRIICEHQIRVPFETYTKLIDYEPGLYRRDFMPPFSEYVDRIVDRGAGGLCWTLAHGLRQLLADIGFDASLMVMEPGHCCVRVEQDGPLYADVGYAAPLFRAYPLMESFVVESPQERFDYGVSDAGITVVRTPGPSKVLDPTPRTIEELHRRIVAANDWSSPGSFLHRLSYSRYVDGVYTSLNDTTLKRYREGGTEQSEIVPDEIPAVLSETFGADPALYLEAVEIKRRHGG